jgi:hypothetical protein
MSEELELKPDKYNKFFVNGQEKPIYVGDKAITYNYEVLYIPIREMLADLYRPTMDLVNHDDWIVWSVGRDIFTGMSMMDATTLPIGNIYTQLMYILRSIDEWGLGGRDTNVNGS